MAATPGRIVWLTGCPCSGKTFIGDYLATQGFAHVDGDGASYSADSEDAAAWRQMLLAFGYWFRGEEAPEELWHGHYRKICAAAEEQAAAGNDVVVTFAIYRRSARDFVRALLPRLLFVWLEVDAGELERRNFERLSKFLAASSTSHEEWWASSEDPNVIAARQALGPWSRSAFETWQKQTIYPNIEPFAEGEEGCAVVDNQAFGGCDAVHTMLGLPERAGDVDAEGIAAVNMERMTAPKGSAA